jgi:hypothetical protein
MDEEEEVRMKISLFREERSSDLLKGVSEV